MRCCCLTLSFLPKTMTFPRVCSFLNLHSTRFCPFSPGSVMLRRATVGLAAPRDWYEKDVNTNTIVLWENVNQSMPIYMLFITMTSAVCGNVKVEPAERLVQYLWVSLCNWTFAFFRLVPTSLQYPGCLAHYLWHCTLKEAHPNHNSTASLLSSINSFITLL